MQTYPVTGDKNIPQKMERPQTKPVEGGGDLPGHKPGTTLFSDGTNEFDASEMRYNFKTKKGKVYNAVTFQSNLYIHGKQTKFIERIVPNDTLQTIYNRNAGCTTCDAHSPHFEIGRAHV